MKNYRVFKAYDDDYINHQMLKELFPGITGRILFQKNNGSLSVITDIDLSDKFKNDVMIETGKDLDTVLLRSHHNFSIRMNPCISAGNNYKQNFFAVKPKDVPNFVSRKLLNIGANILISNIKNEGVRISKRKNSDIFKSSYLVTGSLVVTNKEKFRSTISNGIGRSKFLGFGMLNIFDSMESVRISFYQ